jgi:hypothetical protein
VTKSLGTLIGGAVAVWAVAFLPARLLGGEHAVVYSLTALILCLIPTAMTLAWASRALQRSPSQAMLLVVGGTGVRMTFVLGAGLILYQAVPYFQQTSFWFWILGFYLVTLSLEMLVVRRLKPAGSA